MKVDASAFWYTIRSISMLPGTRFSTPLSVPRSLCTTACDQLFINQPKLQIWTVWTENCKKKTKRTCILLNIQEDQRSQAEKRLVRSDHPVDWVPLGMFSLQYSPLLQLPPPYRAWFSDSPHLDFLPFRIWSIHCPARPLFSPWSNLRNPPEYFHFIISISSHP